MSDRAAAVFNSICSHLCEVVLPSQLQKHILTGRLIHESQKEGFHYTTFDFPEAQLVSAQSSTPQC